MAGISRRDREMRQLYALQEWRKGRVVSDQLLADVIEVLGITIEVLMTQRGHRVSLRLVRKEFVAVIAEQERRAYAWKQADKKKKKAA